jgi:hypothetical protein
VSPSRKARSSWSNPILAASRSFQARNSPGGANIRFIGHPDTPDNAGVWSITGNHISNQEANVHLRNVRGVTVTGGGTATLDLLVLSLGGLGFTVTRQADHILSEQDVDAVYEEGTAQAYERVRPSLIVYLAGQPVRVLWLAGDQHPALLQHWKAYVRELLLERAPGGVVATSGGDGPQLGDARRLVRERGLSDVVRLVGRLSPTELKRLYMRADVFVAPAVQDAFGIAALEAQAAGLAVVSRSQSGVAERLVDGRDALLVDDDAAMADALVRLADDPDLLDRIIAHNRTAELATSWPRVLADTEAAYAAAARLTRADG